MRFGSTKASMDLGKATYGSEIIEDLQGSPGNEKAEMVCTTFSKKLTDERKT